MIVYLLSRGKIDSRTTSFEAMMGIAIEIDLFSFPNASDWARIAIFFLAIRMEAADWQSGPNFLLDKSSGALEYINEELFYDPGGEDFGHWNRHSPSVDA